MLPEINFHVLANRNGAQSLQFVCELIAKHYAQQQKIFVNSASQEDAYKLDDLLWTFEEDSFIPHQLGPGDSLISINYNQQPTEPYEILINFAPQVPTFYKDFKEVLEIVFPDPIVQQLARERYKYYRDQGLNIQTYKS